MKYIGYFILGILKAIWVCAWGMTLPFVMLIVILIDLGSGKDETYTKLYKFYDKIFSCSFESENDKKKKNLAKNDDSSFIW